MQKKFDVFISASCEVKSFSNQLIVLGYICKAGEDFLEISSKSDNLSLEKADSKVKIIINSNKTGWQTLIGTVYLSTNDMMRITNISTIADFEKRKSFRVNLQLDSEAFNSTDTEIDNIINDDNSVIFPVKIKDASLGGLLLESKINFKIGDEIIVLFPVLKKTLYLAVKICRKFKKNGVTGYGGRFIDPPSSELDILYKYLLQQEFAEIKNKKNN